jgi:hypothetical protein
MIGSSPFEISDDMGTKSKFIPAKSLSKDYKSYDNISLDINQKVYQVSMIDGTNTPVVFEFSVKEKLSDGRIKIAGSHIINGSSYNKENTVMPNAVHTDPVKLLQEWIVGIKYKLEIELPSLLQGLEGELAKYVSPDIIENIKIGNGLNQEMEI